VRSFARRPSLPELLIVLLIAGIAAAGGVWLGIVVLAPRLTRIIDKREADQPSEQPEEHGDRPD
jgi:prepilin-type N-terminal cleavage/methylation domain-containing protein